MKMIRVEDSVGCILSHDVTQIIPGEFKGRAFKKGHIIKAEDINKLISIGKEHVYVWEPTIGEVHENDAAIRISELVRGRGIITSENIIEGKVEFFSTWDGVLKVDRDKLFSLNSIGEIIVSTLHNNTPIKKGEKVGATRVVPLIIKEEKIKEAEKLIKEKVIWIEPIKKMRCSLITTGNEIYKGIIKDEFLPVIKNKLEYYGSEVINQDILPDEKERITYDILKALNEKADLIICTGGMSVDPDDVTPIAIKESGAEIITYGSPVLPGAMFLLAYHNSTPILGVPSCVMYSKRTILDLVLPRVLCGEKLTLRDIVEYGHGGLCLDCKMCTYPHCSFGK